MLIRDKDGVTRKARIAPAFWTVLADYDGQERAFEFPSTTLGTWELDIVEASDEERALMREHNILPTEHTLFLVDDETGQRHEVHIEIAPNLLWSRFGCASARDIADGDAFNHCRLVAASPADVKLLRLFGFDPPGLEEIEAQHQRAEPLKRAA
jgi:hypothetical protein